MQSYLYSNIVFSAKFYIISTFKMTVFVDSLNLYIDLFPILKVQRQCWNDFQNIY